MYLISIKKNDQWLDLKCCTLQISYSTCIDLRGVESYQMRSICVVNLNSCTRFYGQLDLTIIKLLLLLLMCWRWFYLSSISVALSSLVYINWAYIVPLLCQITSFQSWWIGHIRVPFCLCFKASLSFALKLVLKQRHERTRKWPILIRARPHTESMAASFRCSVGLGAARKTAASKNALLCCFFCRRFSRCTQPTEYEEEAAKPTDFVLKLLRKIILGW